MFERRTRVEKALRRYKADRDADGYRRAMNAGLWPLGQGLSLGVRQRVFQLHYQQPGFLLIDKPWHRCERVLFWGGQGLARARVRVRPPCVCTRRITDAAVSALPKRSAAGVEHIAGVDATVSPDVLCELRRGLATYYLNSTFCLAPGGSRSASEPGWGVRVLHAALYGCIPVIVQPNVSQALEEALDYSLFAITCVPSSSSSAWSPRIGCGRTACQRSPNHGGANAS
jgi:hypothetical protein